jgi:hypothetical protein
MFHTAALHLIYIEEILALRQICEVRRRAILQMLSAISVAGLGNRRPPYEQR